MITAFRLNLEQQKKRAKELLKAHANREVEAKARFETHHPKLTHKELSFSEFAPKLADAQLVIARELGCKSWPQLREHIVLMDALRGQLEAANVVYDEPDSCLHIRCGSDIQGGLREAGFKGDFLEFSDPLCVGPISYDYCAKDRAEYLHGSYGQALDRAYSDILESLENAYQLFRNGVSEYENVVLWFEHDVYDQFILIFLLSQYHRFGKPKKLWMVTSDAFPGSVRFRGFGQLPPEALRLLWRSKQEITLEHYLEADRHWGAYTQPNRALFHNYAHGLSNCKLPYFKSAALRQLQEQPLHGEIPLTQKLTIELLTDAGSQKAGQLFSQLMELKEPLPFLGDIMYWHILKEMRDSGRIKFLDEPEHWPDTTVAHK